MTHFKQPGDYTMKTFRVYASQVVFHYKDIQAETAEQAEEIAWEAEGEWDVVDFGDWQLEDGTQEIK
jgi:hypothetical protein